MRQRATTPTSLQCPTTNRSERRDDKRSELASRPCDRCTGPGRPRRVLAGRTKRGGSGRRTAEREAAARRIASVERLDEKRHEFQVDLLLQLQDALRQLVRAAAQVWMHDRGTLQQHGKITRLPSEINEESFAAGIELARLEVRILDDHLRGEVDALHKFTSEVEVTTLQLNAMDAEEAIAYLDGLMNDLTRRYTAVTESLGTHLRAELGRVVNITLTEGTD
jgi:hypothetical protein